MPGLSFRKKALFSLIAVIVLGIGVFVFLQTERDAQEDALEEGVSDEETALEHREVIGASVEGREIEAYTFLPAGANGSGKTNILFVGGVHGGYEWNSVLLAYRFIDYLRENPDALPQGISASIIPSANPDGVYKVIGAEGRFTAEDTPSSVDLTVPGRFNARGVDLNRNFDCKWQPTSMWRGDVVSAGSAPFSEPEARAIRDFILENNPTAVIFWHSRANTVYGSECKSGVLPETASIMNAYAGAAGYGAVESFDAYPITGDAEGWLASIGIPAITVELETRNSTEWERNLAGIKAIFDYYSE